MRRRRQRPRGESLEAVMIVATCSKSEQQIALITATGFLLYN